MPSAYNVLLPLLADRFPPHKDGSDFNVAAFSRAMAEAAGKGNDAKAVEAERRYAYKMIGGEESGPYRKRLAAFFDVPPESLPKPVKPLNTNERLTRLELILNELLTPEQRANVALRLAEEELERFPPPDEREDDPPSHESLGQ